MAYALKFPPDVTEIIMSMRDWRYEQVRAEGGTPSARCVPKLFDLVAVTRKPDESVWIVFEPGKLYMDRVNQRNGQVSILIVRAKAMWACGTWTLDPSEVVCSFRDVVGANRVFG